MTEHELLKQAMKENFIDKEQIRLRAMRTYSDPKTDTGGIVFMKKRISGVAFAAMLICISSITAFAISRLLSPIEAAKVLEESGVTAAFENDDAIVVNESVTEGGYTVTFLGISGGKNLGSFVDDRDKNFAIVAIERADGSPMVDNEPAQFFASPLIKGLNPGLYNIVTLNGGYSQRIVDGVLYRIIECDSVEMFADRGLYLCVTESTFYNADAFIVHENTGEITPNPLFSGLHALFTLPIDLAKADPQKAEDYIAAVDASFEHNKDGVQQDGVDSNSISTTFDGEMEATTIMQTAKLIEASQQTLKADASGNFQYSYVAPDGRSVDYTLLAEWLNNYQLNQPFIGPISSSGDGKTIITWYIIYTKQDNGTINAVIYEETITQ